MCLWLKQSGEILELHTVNIRWEQRCESDLDPNSTKAPVYSWFSLTAEGTKDTSYPWGGI